jgi:glutathione synthase/RimK-type ligase-like ATP-grasp enzyme
LLRALLSHDPAAATIGWRDRLAAARRGFLPVSLVLYERHGIDPASYLTDRQRWTRTKRQSETGALNGESTGLLRDKLAFSLLLESVGLPTPAVLAVIRDGGFHRLTPPAGLVPWSALRELLDDRGRLVIKPTTGAWGHNVRILEASNGAYRRNGAPATWETLRREIEALDYHMVEEFVRQAPYATAIFDGTTNVIRVLTLRRREARRVHIAAAVHRFGRETSMPVDNFSCGGLSASIELSSGTLGKAASYPGTGELIWHARHPDTAARIEGARIPNWDGIRETVRSAAERLSLFSYVGWDVVSTPEGCTILEGNASPDLYSLQVHRPLLVDSEVLAFYRERGVVS